MSSEAVAQRYGRALFELARDAGNADTVAKELAAFAETYETSAEFRQIEHAPSLTDDHRQKIVDEVGRRIGASDLTRRTVAMLAQRQRLSTLPDLTRLVSAMADDHLGVVRASVRAAKPLSASYLDRLQRKIEEATGKTVVLTFAEDPALIAGVVTEIGDRVIDGSIRGKLNRLAQSLQQT